MLAIIRPIMITVIVFALMILLTWVQEASRLAGQGHPFLLVFHIISCFGVIALFLVWPKANSPQLEHANVSARGPARRVVVCFE
jgi:hypothetical protein